AGNGWNNVGRDGFRHRGERARGHRQLVYKHAISTIMPGHPIQLFEGAEEASVAEKVCLEPHPSSRNVFAKTMDCRVKPGNDEADSVRPYGHGRTLADPHV